MRMTGYWNGLPTTIERGTAVVADDWRFAQYWARVEGILGQRIPVVWVSLEAVNSVGGVMYLDDRDGIATAKLTEGMGSPRVPHRNVTIVPGSFEAS